MKPTIKAVIFDMDGLMLDTERIAFTAWERVEEETGIQIPKAAQLDMVGRSMQDIEKVLETHLPEHNPKEILAHSNKHYQSLLSQGPRLKPGLLELLDFLEERDIPKSVATSSMLNNAEHKLEKAGIRHRFYDLVTSDQVPQGKPAPDIYEEAVIRLALPPDQCLALEDSIPGLHAALGAGTRVIWIPEPHVERAQAPPVFAQCKDLNEIYARWDELSW